MLLQTYIPLTKSQSDAAKSQSPPSKDENNHAVYFVASIMRVIQVFIMKRQCGQRVSTNLVL